MMLLYFVTHQVKLTPDANKDIKIKKPEKYSPKPGIEPELARPQQNYYNHLAIPPLVWRCVLVRWIYLLNINLRLNSSGFCLL